jgi:hypothetical protein
MNAGMIRAVLICALVPLAAACSTFFDAPRGSGDLMQSPAAKMMTDLAAVGEKEVADVLPDSVKEVGTVAQTAVRSPNEAANRAKEAATTDITNSAMGAAKKGPPRLNAPAGPSVPSPEQVTGREIPTLSFERVEAEMPQLAVQGLDTAVVLVDGEKIGLGGATRAGRIGLIAPGRHKLRVECPYDPPFSADFSVKKGDRVVLRGQCAQTKPVAAKVAPKKTRPPTLTFDKINSNTPVLLIQGLADAAVLVDGEKPGPEGMMEGGRTLTLQPGHHSLQVIPAQGSPFTADFYIETGERATLRGD